MPWYQDISGASVPQIQLDNGAVVRVIAGSAFGVEGVVQRPVTEPLYLDVELPAGVTIKHELAADLNAFIQLYRGDLSVAGQELVAPTMAILSNTSEATGVAVTANEDTRYLLIAGKPLNEPIEQYGPFVMNTKEEIYQAVQDFREGRLG